MGRTISEGSYTFDPAALNSLTKACATGTSDFNDNTLADVEEHDGSVILAEVWERERTVVLPLYRRFLRYAYFVELHTSELRVAGDGSRELWIVERPRSATHEPGHVPVRQRAGASDYWASCRRHDDADYRVDPMSRAGGEFTHLPAEMHHHSQFKCVEVTSRPATRANPERLMLPVAEGECDGAPLCRRSVDGSEREPVRWVLNQCTAMGGGANPAFGCSVVETPVEGVFWASVDYENATESSSTYEYTRGCINECAEIGATACEGAPPGLPADSPQFVCQFAATDAFGKAVCGCAANYGGVDAAGNPTCDIGCPSEHLFSNRTYDRNGQAAGSWVCAHPTTSAAVLTSGAAGGIRLIGEIPMNGGGSEVLSGGDYTLRASSIVAP
jgi:hypothetical protein